MTDSASAAIRLTGGHALARMLKCHAVGPMFGMAGFQLLPFYDAVRTLGLRHHLINDERAGVFAADAYARVSGRPGVCDATLGPGATNLVTGLVESLNAGIPLVAVVGDAHREHAWKNMTQEARQAEILAPAVKELIRVERATRIPELVRRAFLVATSGRPGPVALLLPEDIAHEEVEFAAEDFFRDPRTTAVPAVRSRPDAADIALAADLLGRAERPLILAGGGVHLSGAYEELGQLAHSWSIPVAHTLSGKGSIACDHPRSVGLFGRYSRYANELIETADAVLVVGCKLGEIATKRYTLPAPGTPLIHLDTLPEETGRWAPVAVRLCGDARAGLADLQEALASLGAPPERGDYLQEIQRRHDDWRRSAHERLTSGEKPINMGRLIGEMNRVLPEEAIVVADGGFASHWGGLLYDTKRAGRGFVADRGFASIGYGLPAAIGAHLAVPDRPIVSITGDGGLNMMLGELETARRIGASFTLVVANNGASGYVKALQHAVYGAGSYQSSDFAETDYARVAEAMGCRGIRVEDPEEVRGALEESLRDGPTVLDVVVTRDPARMLPAADSRTLTVRPGDRPA